MECPTNICKTIPSFSYAVCDDNVNIPLKLLQKIKKFWYLEQSFCNSVHDKNIFRYFTFSFQTVL